MKTDYEKYHRKCSRQVKESQRVRDKALAEVAQQTTVNAKLTAKLDVSERLNATLLLHHPAVHFTTEMIHSLTQCGNVIIWTTYCIIIIIIM